MPGFLDVTVHLSYNNATPPPMHYFMSKDGKKIFKAEVYDINKSPFQANLDKLDVKGAPTLGPANAPITVVVFSDFQCPMCKQEAEVIHKQITEAFPTKYVSISAIIRSNRCTTGPAPRPSPGRCVYKLNPAAFWDYHDWIYENQSYIGLDNFNSKLQEFATAKGIDGMQLSRCIENKTTEPEVKASMAIGNSLSLNSTPTIFVNGRRIDGAVPWENLQALIKAEIDHQAKALTSERRQLLHSNDPEDREMKCDNQWRKLQLAAAASAAVLVSFAADINPDQYLAHVRYLASPELKGRATGSPGLEKAAHYIAAQFRSFGLTPAELPFPVTLGAHLGTKNHLKFKEPNEPARTLTSGKDFIPFSFSSSGELHSSVVFAGYGITDKKEHYDDYDGIDVTGKFVLILRHEPKENPHQEHVTFADKAVNAKMHGARGVILVNDTDHHEGIADDIGKFSESAGPKNAGVLYIRIKYDTAEDWVKDDGHDLHALAKQIDQDGHPHSFALPNLTVDLSVDVRTETKTVHNVAAYLPGETDEYVIIGAHYDHLGLGDEHSLAPSQIGTDPSRRRRQRLRNRRRDRTGALGSPSSRNRSAAFCS